MFGIIPPLEDLEKLLGEELGQKIFDILCQTSSLSKDEQSKLVHEATEMILSRLDLSVEYRN